MLERDLDLEDLEVRIGFWNVLHGVPFSAARYANPFANSTTTTSGAGGSSMPDPVGGMLPPIAAAAPPLPPTFGFIPTPAQDDEGINPFSDNPSGTDGSQQ